MRRRRRRNSGKWQKQRIRIGHAGNQVGRAGEERVLKACQHETMPPWWKGIRRTTKEEDAQKVDHVISTDVGEIPLQTKTSLSKKADRSPGRTKNGVAIVRVNLAESDPEIRERVIRIIARERRIKIKKS